MDGIIRAHAEALDTIDDMVDVIGRQIIKIAYDNRDFICSRCLSTAYALFGLMEKYAREEDTADIRDKKNGGDTMSISDYEAHTKTVSDAEISFLAEIFTELIRKEEQHGDNDETL